MLIGHIVYATHSAAGTVPSVTFSGAAAAAVGQVSVFASRALNARGASSVEKARLAVEVPKHFYMTRLVPKE